MLFNGGEYTLVIIEDEQVALAGGIPTSANSFFAISMIIVMIVAFAVAFGIYYMRARHYRECLVGLQGRLGDGNSDYRSWNIKDMKAQIAVLEANIVEQSVGDFFV